METEPFNDKDFTDEQLIAFLALKGRYQEAHGILTEHDIKGLEFTKWLIEHGSLDEFNVPNDAA